MSEQSEVNRRADTSHPDYPEYIAKCRALREECSRKQDIERAKYPDWHGHDHPAGRETRQLEREYYAAIRELNREYAHIFTVDCTPPEE